MTNKGTKRPAKTPSSKTPDKETWKSHACSEGRCKDCKGKIGFICGNCECGCHQKAKTQESS